MGADREKEERIIQGLAAVVGLAEGAPADVLKVVAETLGCTVADDGTTRLAEDDEEPEAGRGKKRRRGGSGGSAAEDNGAAAAADEEEDEEEDEDEEDEDEEGDDGSDGSDGSDEPAEAEEGDEEMEDFDLTIEPVLVEDPRTPDMIQPVEEITDGEDLFQWMLSPVDVETFYDAIHEDEPLLVSRPNNRAYFAGLFSKDEIDRLLRGGGMQYKYNVDVTSYSAGGGKRADFNYNGASPPEEEAAPEMADAAVVWRRFDEEGCSVRMLHPQRFCDPLWRLVARLESFLQCPVGCNAYLTPAGTQGFAPHWDDIDAFVLQVEGEKRWCLYAPTDPEHKLPRYSSRDFNQDELGECVLDVVLRPGDVLYMPRGTVHQAESQPESHSLHLTISANQQRSWAVFLEEALPQALRLAAQDNVELRRCLPRDYFEYMGVSHEREVEAGEEGEEGEGGHEDPRRAAFTQHCAELIEIVMHHMPLDSLTDQFAVQFLQQRMPPPPAKPKGDDEAGGSGSKLGEGSHVRLAQPGIARLVIDTEGPEPIAEVHHCMANRRDLHAKKPADEQEALEEDLEAVAVDAASSLEFPIECAEVIDILLSAGSGEPGAPAAVQVGELPSPEAGCEVSAQAVAQSLLEAGVLVVLSEAEAAALAEQQAAAEAAAAEQQAAIDEIEARVEAAAGEGGFY